MDHEEILYIYIYTVPIQPPVSKWLINSSSTINVIQKSEMFGDQAVSCERKKNSAFSIVTKIKRYVNIMLLLIWLSSLNNHSSYIRWNLMFFQISTFFMYLTPLWVPKSLPSAEATINFCRRSIAMKRRLFDGEI